MNKKIAFLFPGQGSQTVGMLNAFKTNALTADLYTDLARRAHVSLKQDIADLIEHGPSDSLSLTTNTQPAMLFADVLCHLVWRKLGGPDPAMVAGHSLGEYAALVAAGAVSFDEAIVLVRLRAQAMQQAVPVGEGGMAAILGLTDEQVVSVCEQSSVQGELAQAVNFNSPNQVVIAGTAQGVRTACEMAKALGAKRALELPVSAPFHSSLMKPAALQLASALEQVSIQRPQCSLYNNVDVAVETEPEKIKDALVRQAYSPVRWVETIQKMTLDGAELFVECGPGKVLTGLVKRISDVPVISLGDVDAIQLALANH